MNVKYYLFYVEKKTKNEEFIIERMEMTAAPLWLQGSVKKIFYFFF